jgi:hypothetical protein
VDVEHDTVTLPAQYLGQRLLALFYWRAAQLAIKFDQIESAEHGGVVMTPRAEQVKG